MCREPAFKDALPDLIIGLVGIPVGFSLQKVASVMLKAELCPEQQWEGLIYFVLIILLYGLHSVALYMLFEVGQRLTNQLPVSDSQRRVAWQRYLVLRILFVFLPLTVPLVATLTATGAAFESFVDGRSVQFLAWSLDPAWLIFISFISSVTTYAVLFTAAPLSKLLDEYPVVVPYYTAAMATVTVGSILVLFTMN